MEKKHVLFFVDRMRVGGIQIFLLNLLQYFDKEKYQIDFLVLDDGEDYAYEQKVEEYGGKLYKLDGIWFRSMADYPKYCKAVNNFFKEHHDYDVVHMNASSKNFLLLRYAKKYGIRKRIAHSHNTGFQTKSAVKQMVGNVFKLPLKMYATDYFACSKIAGEWLFGKKVAESGKLQVIPNGIALEKFEFDKKIREKTRESLGLNDENLVIGHVGRFTKQKNHKFLLEIFAQILKAEPKAVLLMAGIGELKEEMEAYAKELQIEHATKFLGFRDDVTALTQAMDVFLMPSFYEGFPVTGIEAQASGCPCVFSDTITKEAALLAGTRYISLEADAKTWAEEVLDAAKANERNNSRAVLQEKGFDIEDTVKKLEALYLA